MPNKRRWWRFGLTAVLSVALVCSIAFNLLFQIDYTKGVSMAPTLADGQMLVVWRPKAMATLHVDYHAGDIVVAKNESAKLGLKEGDLLVKRLIGLPGQTVGVTRSTVEINGRPLGEPYVVHAMDNVDYAYGGEANGGSYFRTPGYTATTKLTAHQYFLLGDNRPQSADSRWFGPVRQAQLRGKVAAILTLDYQNTPQRLLGNALTAAPFLLVALLILVGSIGRRQPQV